MPPNRPVENARHIQQWVIIALFIGLLWLPTTDTFLHLDKAKASNENRAPARFPAYGGGWQGVRDYVTGLENYYNDHFGFRKRLIRWNNHWKNQLFKESNMPNAITGRNGWLYFSGDDMIDNCLGISQFKLEELRRWKTLLETRRDWLAKRGIRYLFVVTPNKESVYPEFLPQWMVPVRPTTKLDQFFSYMRTNSTVETLDLRPVLREARKTNLVYMLTDTHWNYVGAFLAHRKLIETLSQQIPGLEPLPLSAFKVNVASRTGGDLARMIGQEQSMPEKEFPTFEARPPLKTLVGKAYPDLLPGKKPVKFDPVITENTNRSGTVILFRDSFSGNWVPFIGQYFKRAVYLFQENWEPEFIEKEKPVLVMDEMVERYFYTADPVELLKLDGLK